MSVSHDQSPFALRPVTVLSITSCVSAIAKLDGSHIQSSFRNTLTLWLPFRDRPLYHLHGKSFKYPQTILWSNINQHTKKGPTKINAIVFWYLPKSFFKEKSLTTFGFLAGTSSTQWFYINKVGNVSIKYSVTL